MITCAIYPRKSRANDNSQSMEQQIEDCKKYINANYPNSEIVVYSGDYGITGHTTKTRKDFQRMMNDIKEKKIQLVVIFRYDRIARNMRDFCNIYHDMEANGCNLVSVSQQIDTSTPYGKNFMYQMANMAELEWAITSERYKDMHRYKIAHGNAYTGKIPKFGFRIEKTENGKKLVHDREEETRDIFEYFLKVKSKNAVVRYVKDKYDKDFTRRMFESMVNSDLYIGKARENENFCEPYFTKEYMDRVRSLKGVKFTPSGRIYLFSGLMRCPICNRILGGNPNFRPSGLYIYYRCPNSVRSFHQHFAMQEDKVEKYLKTNLKAHLDEYLTDMENTLPSNKNLVKSQISKLQEQMKRLDYMFEKGRIEIEEYDNKIDDCNKKIKELQSKITVKEVKAKKVLNADWETMYDTLSTENKKVFWHNIIKEIVVDLDNNITKIIFL